MGIVHWLLILSAHTILLKNVFSVPSEKNVYSDSFNNSLVNAGIVKSYTLALTWPPGACSGIPGMACLIKPVPTKFTIHGLWPDPKGRRTAAFHSNELKPLRTELNTNWPNLTSNQQKVRDNIMFWDHEWNKHGKFSELGERQYFMKTLELFRNGGQLLKKNLTMKNITPDRNKTYKLQRIEAALKKINGGFSVTVVCNERSTTGPTQKKKSTTKTKKQIREVRFKFTKDFRKQNNDASTTCGTATTDVMFPATT